MATQLYANGGLTGAATAATRYGRRQLAFAVCPGIVDALHFYRGQHAVEYLKLVNVAVETAR
jgi:hypothetical protein